MSPFEEHRAIRTKSAQIKRHSKELRSELKRSVDDARSQSQERVARSFQLLASTEVRLWWPKIS